jgi:hypothetical protein
VAAKGQVKKIKGAKKLRRIGRRAAGLKVDNYGRYYRERRVERHKVARMAQSNGPECGESGISRALRCPAPGVSAPSGRCVRMPVLRLRGPALLPSTGHAARRS